MADKDPEDMTASELLRWAANGEPDEYGRTTVPPKLLSALSGKAFENCTFSEDAKNILALADKIDAEIEAARDESFLSHVDSLISLCGYPIRRKGEEVFNEWIERCFIPRPLDEEGEPVQFGDSDIDWDDTDECRDLGAPWEATAVDDRGRLLATAFNKIVAIAKTDENGRVKRPAPEALGADGLPIVEGDVVYELGRDDALTVYEVNAQYIHAKKESGAAWNNLTAKYLTHTPPDTQERIDKDALKGEYEYWGCSRYPCERCPALIDGYSPRQRYDAAGCGDAMVLDLLRRQRELDARKGGE